MSEKKDLYISASSVKTFKSCSLKYYYSKIVQVPEDTNQGALSGGVVHECLEYLLKPKRHALAKDMIAKGELSPSLKRFIAKRCAKVGVTDEKMEDTHSMVLGALTLDFLCEGGEILGTEIDFKIESESPRYKIKGFIDVLVKYGNRVICKDYKSQKKLFTEEELSHNLQGYMYTMAAQEKYPDCKSDGVEFLMLKFIEEQPRQTFKCNKKELEKFKIELAEIYKEMSEFGAENRFDNVARYKEQDADGSFSGKLLCGFSYRPGKLKKNGEPYYACPFKFAVEYYALYEKDGKTLVKTALKEKELAKDQIDGRIIVLKKHEGCEVWK